jgi:hypothetical protein
MVEEHRRSSNNRVPKGLENWEDFRLILSEEGTWGFLGHLVRLSSLKQTSNSGKVWIVIGTSMEDKWPHSNHADFHGETIMPRKDISWDLE